jgi:hypothetical protein
MAGRRPHTATPRMHMITESYLCKQLVNLPANSVYHVHTNPRNRNEDLHPENIHLSIRRNENLHPENIHLSIRR